MRRTVLRLRGGGYRPRRLAPIFVAACIVLTPVFPIAAATSHSDDRRPHPQDAEQHNLQIEIRAIIDSQIGPLDPAVADEEAAAVEAVEVLYRDAGLQFPQVDIRFHDDRALCLGNDGYYRLRSDGTATADVCYSRHDEQLRHIERARTLWHEVAHAYIEPKLNDQLAGATLDLLDLRSWDEGVWSELGSENAAEILVWGISGGQYKTRAVADHSCATRAATYELLTDLTGPLC